VIVFGIDPGWDRCGWAKLEVLSATASGDDTNIKLRGCGLITTSRKESKADRLKELYRQVSILFKKNPKPDILALEEIHLPPKGFRISNLLGLGEARGVLLLAASVCSVNIEAVHPLWVKSTITGNARSSKQDVEKFLKHLLHVDGFGKVDDVADAVAIAYTAALSRKSSQAFVEVR